VGGEAEWLTQAQMFETVVFFVSVLIVNYLIADGRRYVWYIFRNLLPADSSSSNYLEGCMCIGVYLIIALAFYVMPEAPGDA